MRLHVWIQDRRHRDICPGGPPGGGQGPICLHGGLTCAVRRAVAAQVGWHPGTDTSGCRSRCCPVGIAGVGGPVDTRKPTAAFWAGVWMRNAVARRRGGGALAVVPLAQGWAPFFRGLRVPDGAFIFRFEKGRRECYVDVEIGSAFDTAHSGLGLMAGLVSDFAWDVVLVESL